MTDTQNLVTQEDLKLIIKKLNLVKQAGYGEMLVKVKEGKIVYTEIKIGEQIGMDIKD